MTCPDFTRGQNNNEYCWSDDCLPSQITNIEGLCESCPPGQKVTDDILNRSCVVIEQVKCSER
jgi:hypothetical protein